MDEGLVIDRADLTVPGLRDRLRGAPLLMVGVISFCVGIAMYLFGVVLAVPRHLFGLDRLLLPLNTWIVWYSGVPVMGGLLLSLADLFLLMDRKRRREDVPWTDLGDRRVTVVLTAYNDEASIVPAVNDFRTHPLVQRVIVVDNNSRDQTAARAEAAGAITVSESRPGYGRCVYRCLSEALLLPDASLIVLCEGDRTFRAADIDKLLAYAPHADIVNGTRTVEQLRQYRTQLSVFMYFGNLFVGKLLEAKHIGKATLTDVGTTYKLCRRDALQRLMPHLDPAVNLEFNAHFLDRALQCGLRVVECPITFHARIGESKGGNTSNVRALTVGLRMIRGIVFGWKPARA